MEFPKVSLKAITSANFRDCVKLSVSDDQAKWVATNMQSLAQAYVSDKLTPLGVYDGSLLVSEPTPDTPMVGFVMYEVSDEVGFIMRLMIGETYQGKGYGRAALEEVVRRLRMTPNVRYIGTSVVYENKRAMKLYEDLGFADTTWPLTESERAERQLMLPL